MVTSFMCSHRSPRAAGSEGRRWHRPSRRAISRRLKPLRGAEPCVRARSDLSTAHPVRCLLRESCSTARTRSTTISLSNSAYVRGNSLFVLLWFSEWQERDLRRACFQSLRRHICNGLFTGEEFLDWSTTIVVMAAFDSGQLASLRSLTEVFGSMCLILVGWCSSPSRSQRWLLFAGCSDPSKDRLQGYVEGELVYVASPLAGQLKTLSGPQTVPAMERARLVTRQHIQTILNELLERKLVETQDNPAHKSSPLIMLSAEGAAWIR